MIKKFLQLHFLNSLFDVFVLSIGVSINFVKNDDIRILRDIEQYYSTQIDEMPMNGKNKTIIVYSEIIMIVIPSKAHFDRILIITFIFFSC